MQLMFTEKETYLVEKKSVEKSGPKNPLAVTLRQEDPKRKGLETPGLGGWAEGRKAFPIVNITIIVTTI